MNVPKKWKKRHQNLVKKQATKKQATEKQATERQGGALKSLKGRKNALSTEQSNLHGLFFGRISSSPSFKYTWVLTPAVFPNLDRKNDMPFVCPVRHPKPRFPLEDEAIGELGKKDENGRETISEREHELSLAKALQKLVSIIYLKWLLDELLQCVFVVIDETIYPALVTTENCLEHCSSSSLGSH